MKPSAIRKHEPTWHIVDAKGKVVGRLATEVSTLLRGKQKVSFVNHMDCGDHVVVINAKELVLTGQKLQDKTYYRHSWYMGGLKSETALDLMRTRPETIIERAVKGMLPKNKLHNEWMKRLHVYATDEHPHKANVSHS